MVVPMYVIPAKSLLQEFTVLVDVYSSPEAFSAGIPGSFQVTTQPPSYRPWMN